MKKFKSALENFTEYELPAKHKTKIYGGLTDAGSDSSDEFSEDPTGDDTDPQNGTGPRGSGGSSSATSGASVGNPGLIIPFQNK